jgi:hypothetical protein
MTFKSTQRTCSGLIVAMLLGASATTAAANPTTCEQGDLQRTVEVVYANPGQAVPCEVLYTKPAAGTIESLWQANNEAGYCEQQAAEFIRKLEGNGWRCSNQTEPGSPEPE